jgi:pimeloyl-ACP methyl ester carboxylesterase
MAEASVDRCENGRLRTFPDASHWVHHEREEATEALLDHLS